MILIKQDEPQSREKVAEVLSSGGTAIIPTDTVYGLACDASNRDAIERLFLQKRRPSERAIPVFVANVSSAKQIARIDERISPILEQLWPGPLTAVLFSEHKLPENLHAGSATLGIRVSDSTFVKSIIDTIERPLAVTSANISGRGPYHDIERVLADFHEEPAPDIAVDAGVLPDTIASTVVDFTKSPPIILREGPIDKFKLDSLFKLYLGS